MSDLTDAVTDWNLFDHHGHETEAALLEDAARRVVAGQPIHYCTEHLDQIGFGNSRCFSAAWEAVCEADPPEPCLLVDRLLVEP